MAFGFSFGTKKQSGTSDTTMNKTENQQQSGTSSTAQSTNQQSSTSQTGSTTGTTTQSGENASTSQTTGTQQAQQQQSSQLFSDKILGDLEGMVSKLLGSSSSGKIAGMSDFDPSAFVAKGMESATARAQSGLDETINGIISAVGGRGNSAAALLQNRLENDTNASLAGTEGNLEAQAQEILRNNALASSQVGGAQNTFVTQLLDALKGGAATTTGATTETSTQAQQNQGNNSQTGTTAETSQQTSQTKALETMTSLMTQLLSTLTNTTGTESTKTTGKSSGMGMSASF